MATVRALRIAGLRVATASIVIVVLMVAVSVAQSGPPPLHGSAAEKTDQSRARSVLAADAEAADPYFTNIYRAFFETYRVGPEDEIAIRVVGQPDYTLEKAQVSPFGRIYHPLLGDV